MRLLGLKDGRADHRHQSLLNYPETEHVIQAPATLNAALRSFSVVDGWSSRV